MGNFSLLFEEDELFEAESAATQAHKLGLTYGGWGIWRDKSGKPVAKTEKGKLLKLKDILPDKQAQISKIILHKKIGMQRGSNPGGTYLGSDGVKRYVKFYRTETQPRIEHIANAIYKELGINVPQSHLFKQGNQLGYASDMMPVTGIVGLFPNKEKALKILSGFAADVLLANWDAVGLEGDNVVNLHSGDIARIDNGGSLLMRAQGSRKPDHLLYGIPEWEGFVNPDINGSYADVFHNAGYNTPEDMGDLLRRQILEILKLYKRVGGWDKYITKIMPDWKGKDRDAVVKALEIRTQLLAKKLAGIKEAKVYNELAEASGSAAAQAHKLGLKYMGWGKWADTTGKAVAKTVGKRLMKIDEPDQEFTVPTPPGRRPLRTRPKKKSKKVPSVLAPKEPAQLKTMPKTSISLYDYMTGTRLMPNGKVGYVPEFDITHRFSSISLEDVKKFVDTITQIIQKEGKQATFPWDVAMRLFPDKDLLVQDRLMEFVNLVASKIDETGKVLFPSKITLVKPGKITHEQFKQIILESWNETGFDPDEEELQALLSIADGEEFYILDEKGTAEYVGETASAWMKTAEAKYQMAELVRDSEDQSLTWRFANLSADELSLLNAAQRQWQNDSQHRLNPQHRTRLHETINRISRSAPPVKTSLPIERGMRIPISSIIEFFKEVKIGGIPELSASGFSFDSPLARSFAADAIYHASKTPQAGVIVRIHPRNGHIYGLHCSGVYSDRTRTSAGEVLMRFVNDPSWNPLPSYDALDELSRKYVYEVPMKDWPRWMKSSAHAAFSKEGNGKVPIGLFNSDMTLLEYIETDPDHLRTDPPTVIYKAGDTVDWLRSLISRTAETRMRDEYSIVEMRSQDTGPSDPTYAEELKKQYSEKWGEVIDNYKRTASYQELFEDFELTSLDAWNSEREIIRPGWTKSRIVSIKRYLMPDKNTGAWRMGFVVDMVDVTEADESTTGKLGEAIEMNDSIFKQYMETPVNIDRYREDVYANTK